MFMFLTISLVVTIIYVILGSLMKAADKPIPPMPDNKTKEEK